MRRLHGALSLDPLHKANLAIILTCTRAIADKSSACMHAYCIVSRAKLVHGLCASFFMVGSAEVLNQVLSDILTHHEAWS